MRKRITSLLVANRSEIAIRVFRAATELGIRTVAIYSHEDRFALHRFKADEAYQVGKPGEPIRAYLDIDEHRRARAGRTASTPSTPATASCPRTPSFADACVRERASPSSARPRGPRAARRQGRGPRGRPARPACRSCRRRGDLPADPAEARRLAEKLGYPVIVKAAMGGGGRGMRVAARPRRARRGARAGPARGRAAFGVADVFLEKSRRARPAHRGAAPRRPARQPRPPLRARLLACSGAIRRSSRSPPRRTSTRRSATAICDAAVRLAREAALRQRRHGRVPGRRRQRASSTSSRSTRASRSSTPSPRRSPAIDIVKAQILVAEGAALGSAGDRPAGPGGGAPERLRHPVPGHDRGPREQLPARLRPDQRTTARRAAWASASTAARRYRRPSSRRSTTRCW